MTTHQAQELIAKLQEAINEANENIINMDCLTSDFLDAYNYSLFGLDLANAYLDTVVQYIKDSANFGSRYDYSLEQNISERAKKLAQKADDVTLLLTTVNKAVNMINDLTKGDKQ